MSDKTHISRRTVLRGLGAAISLPLLDAMAPAKTWAAAAKAPTAPNRMAFLYVPNGVHMQDWKPAKEGPTFELPWILKPLEPFRKDLLVLSGLAQDGARAHGDGGGDHARSAASFLTGTHPKKTHGADIRAGVSVDQIAAQKVGSQTKFASLELGCEHGAQAGNCDSGYSCAYSSTISWRTESTPLAKEINPRLVFERLFGDSSGAATKNLARRQKFNKSILDYAIEDAKSLQAKLGGADYRKMDEYLSSVRELEQRIVRVEKNDKKIEPGMNKPAGIPDDYGEHIRLMADLLVLAFRTDMTRVSTFLLANEGSNKSYPFLGVDDGHHNISHHGGDKEKHEKIKKINRFHIEQFAYLLKRMTETKEGDRRLIDNVMIVYGSGISDGDRHNHDDLPVLLAGHGCGTIKTGRHVMYGKDTPLNNLYLSMLDYMEADTSKLGDSTGQLSGLSG